jgi:hypothetical protein
VARQGNIKLRDTANNIIYYQWNDIDCLRTKPTVVKQTKPTKATAKIFVKGSKVGNKMINTFKPVIPALINNHSRNYYVTAINNWLHTNQLNTSEPLDDLFPIMGFQFNEQTSLNARLKLLLSVTRTVDNTLLLSVPAFDPVKAISAPANTVRIELCIVACSCDMNNGVYSLEKCGAKMDVDYASELVPAQQLAFPVKATRGHLSVVMVVLKYTINRKGNLVETNDMRWMPAGIVNALYN